MATRESRKPDDVESKHFIEAAEANETEKDADRAFKAVVKPRDRRPQRL